MKEFLTYAPIIIVVIGFAFQYKVFMTPADFQREKSEFLEYIAEHFVSVKTCNSQNAHITDAISLIRADIKQMENKLDRMADLIALRIKQNDEGK